VAALVACVMATGAGGRFQRRDEVPTEPIAGAPQVPAIWIEHDIRFTYVGQVTLYSCEGLRSKLNYILGQLNVRRDFKVTIGCVGEIGSPNLNSAYSNIEYMPHVRIRAATPMEATPELLDELKREAPKRELLARVKGTSKDLDAQTAQFPAVWQRARFTGSRNYSHKIGDGDCELFEHLRDRVFPKLGLKVEEESKLRCDPNGVSAGSIHLAVDMLTPVPPPPAEAQPAGGASADARAVAEPEPVQSSSAMPPD
jgi:hypothetical protein